MWLPINGHPRPSVSDNLYVSSMNMLILLHKVRSQGARKHFWGSDWVLLCLDKNGVLDRVGCDHHAVVGFCVTGNRLAWHGEDNESKTHEVSMSPSSKAQTVISVTVCTPVFLSRSTLYTRTLSLPYLADASVAMMTFVCNRNKQLCGVLCCHASQRKRYVQYYRDGFASLSKVFSIAGSKLAATTCNGMV